MNIGFIGLGLIGGSIARAIKHYYPDYEIMAYDTSRETLSKALGEGIIDYACTAVDEQFAPSDYIFLCAPVHYNIKQLETIQTFVNPDCIITDVGSVKTKIHEKVKELGLEKQFIGGHPMAGAEKAGYENSKRHLIENAYYVLTPSAKVPQDKLELYQNLISSVKAIPLILDYEEHDYITAAISHVPHIIASSLVNMVRESDSDDGLMKTIAAGGFKDITRIASSSPVVWQQICLSNSKNIIKILDTYVNQLIRMKYSIVKKEKDELFKAFDEAKEYRNSIPNASAGPIKKEFSIYCDIIDEAGGIATIATILATNNINIKNIGIVHNREFGEGVLRIEFYKEESSELAVSLLNRHHYTVYKR